MSFGKTVGNVRYTRSYTGERSAGLAGEINKAAPVPEAPVTVTAQLGQDGTYTLVVEAEGQSTTVRDVAPADLADRIAGAIHAVSKAIRNGDFAKHRQQEPFQLGLGTPRPNRDNLRFG